MPTVDARLQAADQRLHLPLRRKVVLLRELRGDLEDLEATLQAEGADPEAARDLALRLLDPSDDALAALERLHTPWYSRLARLPTRSVRVIEGLGIIGMATLAVSAPILAYTKVTTVPTWTAVALGGLAVAAAAHLLWCALRVLVHEDADAKSLFAAGVTQGGVLLLALVIGGIAVALEAPLGVEHALGGDIVQAARAAATSAETIALAVGIAILGLFGTCAVIGAHVLTQDIEEEYRQLLGSSTSLDAPKSA